MNMLSVSHLRREAERTLEQRRDTYPRMVVEGRMDAATATLRLDQQEAIVDALFVLETQTPFVRESVETRTAARLERRRRLEARA